VSLGALRRFLHHHTPDGPPQPYPITTAHCYQRCACPGCCWFLLWRLDPESDHWSVSGWMRDDSLDSPTATNPPLPRTPDTGLFG
jgi:hypothetical protein